MSGDQRHRLNLELLGQSGLIVLGRRGYEDLFKGWSDSDNPMAQLMNSLPKLVFSQSLPGSSGTTQRCPGVQSARRSPSARPKAVRTWSSSPAPNLATA